MKPLHSSRPVDRTRIAMVLSAAVLGLSALAPVAHADQTKANNTDALNLTTSWVSGVVPTASDIAIFDNTLSTVTGSGYSFNLGADTSWAGIKIANMANNGTLSGNTLTIGASGIDMTSAAASTQNNFNIASGLVIGASQTVGVAASRTLVLSGAMNLGSNVLTANVAGSSSFTGIITGGGTIAKTGIGNLFLNANNTNTFTGNITLGGGTLTINNASTLGTGSVVTLNSGTFANLAGTDIFSSIVVNGNVGIAQSSSPTYVAPWSGSGTVTLYGNGTTGTPANQRIIAAGTSNIFDNFTGKIVLTNTSNATSQGLNFGGNRTINYFHGNSLLAVDAGNARVYVQNGGTVTLGSLSGAGSATLAGANDTNADTKNQALSLFIIGEGASSTFGGQVIDGTAAVGGQLWLTKKGATTLTLNGTGSLYTGGLSVLNGTLAAGHASALGAATASTPLVISDVATAATVQFTGGTALTSARPVTINSNATIDASGTSSLATFALTNNAAVTYGASSATLNFTGSNAGNNVFGGSLADNGANPVSVNKSGTGTWVLTGTNTYSGPTTVTGGRLYFNAGAGTGPVSVTAGTFGGSGATGAISVSTGARLAAGSPLVNSGVGTLTSSSIALANGSGLDLEFIGGGANDTFALGGGTLSLGTGINVVALQGGTQLAFSSLGTYTIFSNVGTLVGSPSNLTVSGGDPTATYVFSQSGANIILTIAQGGNIWIGNTDDWSTGTNWNGITPGAAVGDLAVFSATGNNRSVNLNGSRTLGILSLDAGAGTAYTLNTGSGGSLVMNNGASAASILNKSTGNTINAAVDLQTDVNIAANVGTTLNLAGAIGASNATAAVNITGPGLVVFSAANTYAGTTTVNAISTLQLNTGGTFGAGNIINNGSVNFNTAGVAALSNVLTGLGTWNQIGSGTTTLNGASTISGTVTVANGTLQSGAANLAGLVNVTGGTLLTGSGQLTGTANVSGGQLTYGAANPSGSALNIIGPGKVDLNGNAVTLTTLTSTAGTLTNSGAANTLTLSTTSATTSTFAGLLSGNMTLFLRSATVGGTGNGLFLNNTNTYTGKTIIGEGLSGSGGQITYAANGALSNTEIDVFGGGATINIGNGLTLCNNIVLNTTSGAATFVSAAGGTAATYAGNLSSVRGSGANYQDYARSSVKLGSGSANATMTYTGNINAQGTNDTTNLFSPVLIGQATGTVNLQGATVNAGISGFDIGRAGSNTSMSFNFTASTLITNGSAGQESMVFLGNSTNPGSFALNVDHSTINLNAGNLNIQGSTNASASTDMGNVNFNASTLTLGGFTKTTTSASERHFFTFTDSTIVAGTSNSAFLGSTIGNNQTTNQLIFMTNTATINTNGYAITIAGDIQGGASLTKTGAGTLTFTSAGLNLNNNYAVAGGVLELAGVNRDISTVSGAGTYRTGTGVTVTSDVITTGGLEVNGTHVLRNNGTPAASKVNALTIAGGTNAWTGKLDTTINPVIVQTTGATKAATLANLANQVLSGSNGGSWNGNGITSSSNIGQPNATLAIVANSDLGLGAIGGQTLDANSVFVTRALMGDANLDGNVDLADYDVWYKHVGTGTAYSQAAGDLNADGNIDLADYDMWYKHVGAAPLTLASQPALGGGIAAVPEPASLAVLALGSAALLGSRRRRK